MIDADNLHNHVQDKPVRSLILFALCLMTGGLAISAAVLLGNQSKTVIVVGILAMAAIPITLILWTHKEAASILVATLAFSIPINIDVNLFYRYHVGGAPSITINLTLLLLALFFLFSIYRYACGQQANVLRFYRPLYWSGLALLALTPMSLLNAMHPELVWLEWFRLLCLVFAMFATMSLQEEKLIRVWIYVLSLQVLIQAGLAGMQYALKRTLGLDIFGEEALVSQNIGYIATRATGTVGHPNVLSYFFEILVPIMLALALTKQPGPARLWFSLVFVAGLAGVLTTLSRGSWLTFPFSLSIVFIFVYGRRIVRTKAMVMAFFLGCVLISALYFALPVIEKRFTHTDYKSSGSRMPLNRAAVSIIEKYPIFGIGLNNFAESFKRHDETGLSRIFKGYQHVVHNLHLWIMAETGIVGLLAYLAPFFITMRIAWKIGPRSPPVPRAILVGIAAGLLAHLAHGMVDPGFRVSVTISFLVFTLMGISGALAIKYSPSAKSNRGAKLVN